MIVVSATSAGGPTALAMKTLRGRTDDPATPARPEGQCGANRLRRALV
jgi:hypothetical protein